MEYICVVRDGRGTITIEYMLVTALSMLLVFGALEFARAAAIKHALGVGSWQAARCLSLNPWDEAVAESLARQSIQDSLFGGNSAPAVVWFSFSDPARRFGTTVAVRIEMPYRALVPLMNLAPRTLTGESAILVEAWP